MGKIFSWGQKFFSEEKKINYGGLNGKKIFPGPKIFLGGKKIYYGPFEWENFSRRKKKLTMDIWMGKNFTMDFSDGEKILLWTFWMEKKFSPRKFFCLSQKKKFSIQKVHSKIFFHPKSP